MALILVKAGANVNAKGLDDDTPLHDAAIVGQLKLVKLLVERGADVCFKNRKGKTACDVAAPAVYSFLLAARGKLYIKYNIFHQTQFWYKVHSLKAMCFHRNGVCLHSTFFQILLLYFSKSNLFPFQPD